MAFKRKRVFKRALRRAKRARIVRRAVAKSSRFRRSSVRNRSMASIGQGFPKKILMTHKYTDVVTVTSTTGALGTYRFACNGMYDPNITGTGHQPMYFDQMSAIYNHWVVIGSRIRFTVTPQTTAAAASYVGLWINDNNASTNINAISDVAEQGTGYVRQFSTPANVPLIMTKKWSAKKFFGRGVMANNALQGTSGSNPTELSYYELVVNAANNATIAYHVKVDISYIAIWSEVQDIAPS